MNEEQPDTLTLWGAFILLLKAMAIFILLIVLLMFVSCSTVKKSTTRSETKTDSTGSTKTETARIIKADSTGTKSEAGNYEKVTVYNYDTVYYVAPGRTDTIIKYVPRIITIYEKGSYNRAETANKSNVDSGGVKQDQTVTVAKESKIVTKDKKSSRFPWWIIMVIVIAGGLWWSAKQYFKKIPI